MGLHIELTGSGDDDVRMTKGTVGNSPIDRELTDAQLHGRACITCDTGQGPLVPAGHAHTPTSGAPLGWAVVACPAHAPEETR
jgi:hypothetical protein